MNLKILVQDKNGSLKDELVVDVSDDMTTTGLLEALKEENIIGSSSYNVFLGLDGSDALASPKLKNGSTVIVREHKSRFRIIDRNNND